MAAKRIDKLDAALDELACHEAEAPVLAGGEAGLDRERLAARQKLCRSEKVLSGLIYERVESPHAIRRVHIKGDQALFGGETTRTMKKRLGVPRGRALADFLPTITIKAKDFANELTNFHVKRDYLHTEAAIAREHVKSNREVRALLGKRRIKPEELPAAEDSQKVERRLRAVKRMRPGRSDRQQSLPNVGQASTSRWTNTSRPAPAG